MIWSPAMISIARSCRRQWGLRYGVIPPSATARRPARVTAQPPEHARLGTLAHAGVEAAYLAAQHARVVLAGSRMDAYEENALLSMNGAALELDLAEQDVYAAQDDVVRTLAALPAPLPDAVLGVEKAMHAILPSGRHMRGRADLILKTGRNTAHIRDWKRKSAKSLPRPDDLLLDDALGFYAYAQYRQDPTMLVSVGLYSLRDQVEVYREFPPEAALAAARKFDDLIDSVESDETLLPTPRGGNCESCPVATSCPKWKDG